MVVDCDNSGIRTGIKSYFLGLTENQGPVCTITPSGLKRHRVSVHFGPFSKECVTQMKAASAERLAVARALLQGLSLENEVIIYPSQQPDSWTIDSVEFRIEVVVKNVAEPTTEDALIRTARKVMTPLMAAMAELIGYDEINDNEPDFEGSVIEKLVLTRERSPRNRLLCLALHGNICAVCGFESEKYYRGINDIIEVHHLEPLGMLENPQQYDPKTDLVPLCPNCHRAIHKRKPIPFTPNELRELLSNGRYQT